jgi:hypothetical protein
LEDATEVSDLDTGSFVTEILDHTDDLIAKKKLAEDEAAKQALEATGIFCAFKTLN